jgi:hypothetical protein
LAEKLAKEKYEAYFAATLVTNQKVDPWHHDIQLNDTDHNNTQYNGLI